MEPEICTKMLKKLAGSMVKIACLDDAFLKVFQLQAIPVEGQSLQQKEKKRRKRKGQNFFFKSQKA